MLFYFPCFLLSISRKDCYIFISIGLPPLSTDSLGISSNTPGGIGCPISHKGSLFLTAVKMPGNTDVHSVPPYTLPPIDHFSLPFGTYSCIHLIALLHRHLELHFHVKILSSSDQTSHLCCSLE